MIPLNHPKMRLPLINLLFTTVFGSIFLIHALDANVWTVPYLSPLAKLIAWAAQPLQALDAPIWVGVMIKICRSLRRMGVVVGIRIYLGSVVGCLLPLNAHRLWVGSRGWWVPGERCEGSWCAVGDCWRGYVQVALLVAVVVAEVVGWRWEAGWVDWWIAQACSDEIAARRVDVVDELERGGEVTRDEKSEMLTGKTPVVRQKV